MSKNIQVLLFGGTVEGRQLAELLDRSGIPALVSVATEYGEEILPPMTTVEVQQGRLDQDQMVDLMEELQPQVVIDATHPYADVVTANIQEACQKTGLCYRRLLRDETDLSAMEDLVIVPDTQAAADWLKDREGNILLTTGIKELPVFAEIIPDRTRIYARVLLQECVFDLMEQYELTRKQMICMQGPFSRELNVGMLKQIQGKYLVTKESGKAGGFREKLEAAREAGAICVIIARPQQVEGLSYSQMIGELATMFPGLMPEAGTEEKRADAAATATTEEMACGNDAGPQTVTLVGIGMGAYESLTVAAVEACREADLIIGAKRMLETTACFGKPQVSMYLSDEITGYVKEHPEYRRIVVALSGDIGFYSGAKKLIDKLESIGATVETVCGISSVVAFAARLRTSWEDVTLVSTHGRKQNLMAAVLSSPKVFTLLSKSDTVRALAQQLIDAGLETVTMHVGTDLSYPNEAVTSGRPIDFINYEKEGNSVALIENPQAMTHIVTPGIPDDAFIRGKVPMTKEEVRIISLAKMQLTRQSVVYDIGAGTGSISIECARLATDGHVYAVERKEEAVALIHENKNKFAITNLDVIEAYAPEGLADLPAPTHAFIGGSGGNLREIISNLYEKNPQVRIVVNCIALETLTEVMDVLKEFDITDADISSVSVAKSKELAGYHMMMGQNPVYIIAFGGVE